MNALRTLAIASLALPWLASPARSQAGLSPAEARAIAKEAHVYGFPMVGSYRIQHDDFVDSENPEFKAPWNHLKNIPRGYTPQDTAVQAPNSETPYSMLGADLRAEPLVLTVPEIDPKPYDSLQFIDLSTHNFAYVGSRTTGNGAGHGGRPRQVSPRSCGPSSMR